MIKANARIQTENPQRLMNRLCKHWGHKFPVTVNDQEGEIQLTMGLCHMHCTGDILTVELESDAEQMPKLQEVVAVHLHRMANKETIVIEWQ